MAPFLDLESENNGGPAETNNQAHRVYVAANPRDEDPPYAAVACDVAVQSAKPKTLEEVLKLEVGDYEGNRKCLVHQSLVRDADGVYFSCICYDGSARHDTHPQAHKELGSRRGTHHRWSVFCLVTDEAV